MSWHLSVPAGSQKIPDIWGSVVFVSHQSSVIEVVLDARMAFRSRICHLLEVDLQCQIFDKLSRPLGVAP